MAWYAGADNARYAIFDEKKFDCVGVKVVHIGNIHYEWKEL